MIAKIASRALPELPDDSDATLQQLIEAASGADDYWPNRVEGAFRKAGFAIRRVQREESHPSVWTVWLTRGAFDIPAERKAASAQIRRALANCGLKIAPRELAVLEQRGEKLKCAFIFGPSHAPEVVLD